MARLNLRNPVEVATAVGQRAKRLRLHQELTQATLAKRAGVGLRTLQRFEDSGSVGVDAMVRIAFALGVPDCFDNLFPKPVAQTLDELLESDAPRRKRGRA